MPPLPAPSEKEVVVYGLSKPGAAVAAQCMLSAPIMPRDAAPAGRFHNAPAMKVELSAHTHTRVNPWNAVLIDPHDTRWPGASDHGFHEGDALAMNCKAWPRPFVRQRDKAYEVACFQRFWVRQSIRLLGSTHYFLFQS